MAFVWGRSRRLILALIYGTRQGIGLVCLRRGQIVAFLYWVGSIYLCFNRGAFVVQRWPRTS